MWNHLNNSWSDAIDRAAEGINVYELGQIQEISEGYIVTERCGRDEDKFIITKTISSQFDVRILHFNLSEEDSNKYKQ